MSKQALKRVRRHLKIEVNREPLPKYSSVGCYPLYYVTSDCACLCADCVNDCISSIDDAIKANDRSGWKVDAVDVNYEDGELHCDNCSKRIESAYAEDDAKGGAK